jgi:hypothetical protein
MLAMEVSEMFMTWLVTLLILTTLLVVLGVLLNEGEARRIRRSLRDHEWKASADHHRGSHRQAA